MFSWRILLVYFRCCCCCGGGCGVVLLLLVVYLVYLYKSRKEEGFYYPLSQYLESATESQCLPIEDGICPHRSVWAPGAP